MSATPFSPSQIGERADRVTVEQKYTPKTEFVELLRAFVAPRLDPNNVPLTAEGYSQPQKQFLNDSELTDLVRRFEPFVDAKWPEDFPPDMQREIRKFEAGWNQPGRDFEHDILPRILGLAKKPLIEKRAKEFQEYRLKLAEAEHRRGQIELPDCGHLNTPSFLGVDPEFQALTIRCGSCSRKYAFVPAKGKGMYQLKLVK